MGGAVHGEPSHLLRGLTLSTPCLLLAGMGQLGAAIALACALFVYEGVFAAFSSLPSLAGALVFGGLTIRFAGPLGISALGLMILLQALGAWLGSPKGPARLLSMERAWALLPLACGLALALRADEVLWTFAMGSLVLLTWTTLRLRWLQGSEPAHLGPDGGVYRGPERVGTAVPPASAEQAPILAWALKNAPSGYREDAGTPYRIHIVNGISARPPTADSTHATANAWALASLACVSLALADGGLWQAVMRHIPW